MFFFLYTQGHNLDADQCDASHVLSSSVVKHKPNNSGLRKELNKQNRKITQNKHEGKHDIDCYQTIHDIIPTLKIIDIL